MAVPGCPFLGKVMLGFSDWVKAAGGKYLEAGNKVQLKHTSCASEGLGLGLGLVFLFYSTVLKLVMVERDYFVLRKRESSVEPKCSEGFCCLRLVVVLGEQRCTGAAGCAVETQLLQQAPSVSHGRVQQLGIPAEVILYVDTTEESKSAW